MRPVGFQSIIVTSAPGALPIQSSQGSPTASNILRLACVSVLGAAVLIPQFWLAGHALTEADFRAQILAQPLQSGQILAAFAFWIVMFAWPIRKLLQQSRCRRHVEIDNKHVTVREETTSGAKLWREPLSAYLGVAHHVRSSLSGVRQELILVHAHHTRSVVFLADEHISENKMSDILRLLQLPRVPSSAVYGFGAGSRASTTTEVSAEPLVMAA